MESKTWGALRQIMCQPSAVWLATEYSGDRWLTDQFVLLLAEEWTELDTVPDGPYKLTVKEGPQPRDAVPEPDLQAWFESVADREWHPAYPSEWSVAEHPGKAMLWAVEGEPYLLSESTWTTLKRHYPELTVTASIRVNDEGIKHSLFRFHRVEHDGTSEMCAEDCCNCADNPVTFAYAAGIRIPDGQEPGALAIVEALDATST